MGHVHDSTDRPGGCGSIVTDLKDNAGLCWEDITKWYVSSSGMGV
jgi:hypothetical protein